MVDEKIISGYCRQLDGSRIVTLELDNGCITDIDCRYGECLHQSNCAIAREIDALAEE